MKKKLSHDEYGKASISVKKDGYKGLCMVCVEVKEAAGAGSAWGTLWKTGLS